MDKPKAREYYDSNSLESWFKTNKNINISEYLRERYMDDPRGNGIMISLYLEDDLEDACPAQKAMFEVFKKDIKICYNW